MTKQFASWLAAGQNISVITYDLVCGALAALSALAAALRLLAGHPLGALVYFAFALAQLCLFLFANAMIQKDTLQKLFQKGFPALVAVAVFGMTLLYFADGGMQGGSVLFAVLFIALMPLLFRVGRYLWYMSILLFVSLFNIATSLLYPESVRGTGYTTFDFLVPFLVTLLVLGMVVQLYTYAYHRQKAVLTNALEEARRTAASKSRFLDNMSDEIRKPMQTILGMNELVLREEQRPEILAYAAEIKRSGNSLLAVINDIIDYSRIQDHEMHITPVSYDLSSMINDMVTIAADLARNKSLEFQVYVDRDVPRNLVGDEFHIRQILLNILGNAVKYTDRGGVTFRASFDALAEDEILLRFAIADTGIGIREEDLEQIFMPFEHASHAALDIAPGSGLGLSIVRSLLEMMDSQLDIHSIPGQGSTFSFGIRQKVRGAEVLGDYSRAWREAGVHNTEHIGIAFTAPDAQILAVDDTPVNLVVFRSLLKDTQIKIDTANSGEEMLQMIRIKPYDLIFLDHRMPGMDGIAAFHAMKRLVNIPNAETPVIALTANAVTGARQTYLSEGFRDYLAKPLDGVRLTQMIRVNLPAEKVQTEEAQHPGDGVPAQKAEAPQAPAEELVLQGIDHDAALEHCGSEEVFREALQIFYDTIEENADKIEVFAKEGDWRNYTVLVHALKSSARLVGALALSGDAMHLEDAGNAQDAAEITAKTPQLLTDYRAYLDYLAPVCGREEDTSALPEMAADELDLFYTELRRLAEEFDLDGLDALIASAEKYRLPENEQERFKRVKISVRNADWGELEEALST